MWQVWVDTGGTFTDCLGVDPDGVVHRAKLLSSGVLRGEIHSWIDPQQVVVRLPGVQRVGGLVGWRFEGTVEKPKGAAPQAAIVSSAQLMRDGCVALMLDQRCQDARESREAGDSVELCGDEPAPILAARLVTGTGVGDTLPELAMRLATTRGTNALLERTVARTALFVTQGFGDLLVIGEQHRPDLFALRIEKPLPLYDSVVEVRERIDAAGNVLHELDVGQLRDAARALFDDGVRVAAVALANSYVHAAHEKLAEDVLRDVGFDVVACSAELAPLIGYVARVESAVVDAALSPVIRAYVDRVQQSLTGGSLLLMTSAGGLVAADSYRAMDSLLSGPAGGVGGAAAAARQSGLTRSIAFDMGGTSTDVSRWDGDFEYQFEQRVGGARVLSPALAIETVAAGGGSICRCVEDRLTVGPGSAGAQPGPACYGAGGPLTVTDVNLLSGRIDAARFSIPIDVQAARRAFDAVCADVEASSGNAVDRDAILDGFLAIANERMATAIERISLRKGYDPAEYGLVAFGGAGGQHACAVAQRLGMTTVVVPSDASLLSAVGLGHAVIERFAQRQVLQSLEACGDQWRQWMEDLAQQAVGLVEDEGIARDRIEIRRRIVNVRLMGQDTTLDIEVDETTQLCDVFAARYRQMYGYDPPNRSIEIESMRVVASHIQGDGSLFSEGEKRGRESFVGHYQDGEMLGIGEQSVRMRAGGRWCDVKVYERSAIAVGGKVVGPALVTEQRSVIVVEPGWSAQVDFAGAVVMECCEREDATPASGDAGLCLRDGEVLEESVFARAELYAHRLTNIALEMGQLLQRTAMSTNIKQRLDFSCAVLNPAGELVVNAPHLPVHLGAMGVCVRAVREQIKIGAGDVVVTNHPACGGSHLPDVTVISAAFDEDGVLIGYVANRTHHAEIGGLRPGSMPPNATRLIEEGVVLEPQYLIRNGAPQFDLVQRALETATYPSRNVVENIADLRAQARANRYGVEELQRLAAAAGVEELHAQMRLIEERAERVMRRVIAGMPGQLKAEEFLDDGARIRVEVVREKDELIIDVEGKVAPYGVGSGEHPGNLNAPPAVTHSAVLYVLRVLGGEDMPLNEAMLRPVRVRIGPGMLNPNFDLPMEQLPAVVGGNVETSQRVVDTLIKAFGLLACGQGTMNNTLFGNDRFGYYETVCGGAGAGPGFDGADAVHTHMTNTRITDVEVMEQRYPVRVRRFVVRRGSGGGGAHKGGDGVVRELEFLEDVSLSLVSQHRVVAPFGMHGGAAGAVGRQRIVRANGSIEELRGIDAAELRAGDVFVLETPGGGGWGEAEH